MGVLKRAIATVETGAKLAYTRTRRNTVAAAYYKCLNFGDLLTPDVLQHFGLRCVRVPLHRYSSVVGVGSILHLIPPSYNGTILGSGFICPEHFNDFPNASVKLVRGELTRQVFGNSHDVKQIGIGDPGLLARDLYNDTISASDKKFKLGVIPHYVDADNPRFRSLAFLSSPEVTVLDVRCQPIEMAARISECEHIISSSLHGLIFADSLGIPNRWVRFSNDLIGGDFKFRDYYSCFHLEMRPIDTPTHLSLADLSALTLRREPTLLNSCILDVSDAIKKYCSSRSCQF